VAKSSRGHDALFCTNPTRHGSFKEDERLKVLYGEAVKSPSRGFDAARRTPGNFTPTDVKPWKGCIRGRQARWNPFRVRICARIGPGVRRCASNPRL